MHLKLFYTMQNKVAFYIIAPAVDTEDQIQ